MSKRRSTAKPSGPAKAVKPDDPFKAVLPGQTARPPLPSTSRSYGKVTGSKGGKPLVPKVFSHRKRG
jgi:hypothetical protein